MKGMLLLNNAKGVRQLRFQGCLGNKTANSERVGELLARDVGQHLRRLICTRPWPGLRDAYTTPCCRNVQRQ